MNVAAHRTDENDEGTEVNELGITFQVVITVLSFTKAIKLPPL